VSYPDITPEFEKKHKESMDLWYLKNFKTLWELTLASNVALLVKKIWILNKVQPSTSIVKATARVLIMMAERMIHNTAELEKLKNKQENTNNDKRL